MAAILESQRAVQCRITIMDKSLVLPMFHAKENAFIYFFMATIIYIHFKIYLKYYNISLVAEELSCGGLNTDSVHNPLLMLIS